MHAQVLRIPLMPEQCGSSSSSRRAPSPAKTLCWSRSSRRSSYEACSAELYSSLGPAEMKQRLLLQKERILPVVMILYPTVDLPLRAPYLDFHIKVVKTVGLWC
eukprot:s8895_g1.t1